MGREEQSIAVVCHSGFLYTLVNCGVLSHSYKHSDDSQQAVREVPSRASRRDAAAAAA